MTYYSHTEHELSQLGIQEGELAIYTGTKNPRTPGTLSPNTNSQNAYVYIWQDGQPRELDTCFRCDRAGLDVLEVRTGEEEYTFLREKYSGYIRQLSGPPKPIAIANIGAIPLRVDTNLGKFTIHAGTMLRLDENAPRREKKKVLLTVSSRLGQSPLKSAKLWDGVSWRRLNIREDPPSDGEDGGFAALDGRAIVQYLKSNEKREIFIMDSPEPDPDYEIYVTTQGFDRATLCFNRSDYRDGRVVQRKRTIAYGIVSAPGVYDLQKLKETQSQSAIHQCIVELPKAPDGFKPPARLVETSLPDDQTGEFTPERRHPLISDKLREFLESENKLGEQPSASEKALIPEPPESFPE